VDPRISGPAETRVQADLARHLPKIWIGYLLCVATFVDEAAVVAGHPEIASGQLFIPPLHLFLLGFVSLVYWLVCVHKLHVVLAFVPGWKHPVSPARAVWFHFIPIYSIYWLYRWPREAAGFVNWRMNSTAIQPRNAGLFVLASYFSCLFLGPGGLILLFFSLSYLTSWVARALAWQTPPPGRGEDSST
jgi:hypothetical protein